MLEPGIGQVRPDIHIADWISSTLPLILAAVLGISVFMTCGTARVQGTETLLGRGQGVIRFDAFYFEAISYFFRINNTTGIQRKGICILSHDTFMAIR